MELYGVLITDSNKSHMLDAIFDNTGQANKSARVFDEPGEYAKIVILEQVKGCAVYQETKTRYHYVVLHPSKFEESNKMRSGGFCVEFETTDAGLSGVPTVI